MFPGAVVADRTVELHACLDRLGSLDLSRLTGQQQAALLRELARAESRVSGLRLALLAAAEMAETAREAAAASTGQWAAKAARADGGEAQRQVDLARRLERRSATRRALAGGEISPGHAEVIVRADSQLPVGLGDEARTIVESSLLEKALTMSPEALRRVARRAIAVVEPDPAAVDAHEDVLLVEEETRARATTRLTLHDNHDGTVTGRFTVPTLQGHLLRKILRR
jgi:hypothetical protein